MVRQLLLLFNATICFRPYFGAMLFVCLAQNAKFTCARALKRVVVCARLPADLCVCPDHYDQYLPPAWVSFWWIVSNRSALKFSLSWGELAASRCHASDDVASCLCLFNSVFVELCATLVLLAIAPLTIPATLACSLMLGVGARVVLVECCVAADFVCRIVFDVCLCAALVS
jgi:hypothetical protein